MHLGDVYIILARHKPQGEYNPLNKHTSQRYKIFGTHKSRGYIIGAILYTFLEQFNIYKYSRPFMFCCAFMSQHTCRFKPVPITITMIKGFRAHNL